MAKLGTTLQKLSAELGAFSADRARPDDKFITDCLREAITAAAEGNFGVGAVLVNNRGDTVEKGRNRVFSPRFRSDMHAEMDVLTRFEKRRTRPLVRGHTLYTSVECCPMCLARLITAGVSRVAYAASDTRGGMIHRMDQLPPVWQELASSQAFGKADCSRELILLAETIFQSSVATLDKRLRQRR